MDNKITGIFYNLINSGTTFISNINHKHHYIEYKVGGETISLKVCEYLKGKEPSNQEDTFDSIFQFKGTPFCWYCDMYHGEETNVIFALTIRDKEYFLPRLNRVEQANVIETIENTIRRYEEELITKISNNLVCAVSK